jgi:hypothetical protein
VSGADQSSGIVVSFFTGGAFCGAGLAGPVNTLFRNLLVTWLLKFSRLEIDSDEE